MELFEAIHARHSYRGAFTDALISRHDLRKIVQAGIQAPSAKNEQTTVFIIVDDQALLKEIGMMHSMMAMNQAKAMIACVIDREPEPVYQHYSFQIEDCAAAVENMLLAITALGYASVWIDGWLRLENRAMKIGNLLGLPESKIIRVLLPIGVPQEKVKQREKKPFQQRAWFNQYRQGE